MADRSNLYVTIDVSEALRVLDLSQLTDLIHECRIELERRLGRDM